MAKELSSGEADIIISPLSSTPMRRKLIDYSMPITQNQPVLITKRSPFNPPQVNLWVYLDPFTLKTWLIMVAFTFMYVCMYLFINNVINALFC